MKVRWAGLSALNRVSTAGGPRPSRALWKENPDAGGGTLLDLGRTSATRRSPSSASRKRSAPKCVREKDGPGVNDAFDNSSPLSGLRRHPWRQQSLSLPAAPRFHLRGTKGNYWKSGVDPQEAALNKVTRIDDPAWGQEPSAAWGILHVDIDGGSVSRPVPSLTGDYRLYYAGIRDALLGKAAAPVSGIDGWRAARLLE